MRTTASTNFWISPRFRPYETAGGKRGKFQNIVENAHKAVVLIFLSLKCLIAVPNKMLLVGKVHEVLRNSQNLLDNDSWNDATLNVLSKLCDLFLACKGFCFENHVIIIEIKRSILNFFLKICLCNLIFGTLKPFEAEMFRASRNHSRRFLTKNIFCHPMLKDGESILQLIFWQFVML